MQVQVRTDNHIKGSDELFQKITAGIESDLSRFDEQITRVEVYLADVNGPKGGDSDIRCTMEVRLGGHQPIAVTHNAHIVYEAVDGASEKALRAMESKLGRIFDPKGQQTSIGGDQVI